LNNSADSGQRRKPQPFYVGPLREITGSCHISYSDQDQKDLWFFSCGWSSLEHVSTFSTALFVAGLTDKLIFFPRWTDMDNKLFFYHMEIHPLCVFWLRAERGKGSPVIL
jgi:hypothetical protein